MPRVFRSLSGLIQRIRHYGPVTAVRQILWACQPKLFRIYRWHDRTGHRPQDIEIHCETELLARLRSEAMPPEFFLERTQEMKACAFALVSGRLAGIIWSYGDRSSRFLSLSDSQLEVGRLLVVPEFRGQGVATSLIMALCAACREQELFAVVADANFRSWRAFESCGFKQIAAVQRPELFGKRLAPSGEFSKRPDPQGYGAKPPRQA